SVRTMLLARLAPLSQTARQVVQASAVLGTQASAQRLWQVAEMEVQVGVEALEEAEGLGILVEETAGGPGAGRQASYGFSHELMREVVYIELGAARRQVLHQRVLAVLESEEARASELAYHALLAAEAEAAYRYSLQAGDEAGAVFAVAEAIRHYEQARALLQEHPRLQSVLSAPEVEHLYVYLGLAYVFQNTWEKAQEAYEELLAYAQHRRLPALASLTLNRLAILAVQQSYDKLKVRVLLEHALHMAQTSQDQRALAETELNLAQITSNGWQEPMRALPHGEHALSLARAIQDTELEARYLFQFGLIHLSAGDFEEAMHALEAALALYAAVGTEPTASQELSVAHAPSDASPTQRHHHIHQTTSFHPLPSFVIGAPLTQPLTNRATEAVCWAMLAMAHVQVGQVQQSLRSGRRALALAQEIKNVWVQITSTYGLTYGLLEAGAYEEALVLTQPAVALARTLPPSLSFQRLLTTLGSTYQALQQWEEAQAPLQEAVAVAEALDLGPPRVPALSRLCRNCAVAGEWQAASHYALQAIAVRNSVDAVLLSFDFSRQYETEALLRGGDERQARAEVQQLGERAGTNRRFRLTYLRSLAVLSTWDGHSEQAIGHLREAAQIAADLGLPAEQWQIQATLATVYQAVGDQAQAHTAFGEAARIIQGLAEDITDETLRTRFLTGPQIQPVLQMGQ
ncbi:MAG TPA: tetratricopeptide repeat protein, partial [Ktedonobacteraceae bacterium]